MMVDTETNVMKPLVFSLFLEVCQIKIWTNEYPFDLMSFLRLIRSVDMPETLELILIEGGWIERAFTKKVEQGYIAAGFEVEKNHVYGHGWSLKLKF